MWGKILLAAGGLTAGYLFAKSQSAPAAPNPVVPPAPAGASGAPAVTVDVGALRAQLTSQANNAIAQADALQMQSTNVATTAEDAVKLIGEATALRAKAALLQQMVQNGSDAAILAYLAASGNQSA